jgi:hypothetical protein
MNKRNQPEAGSPDHQSRRADAALDVALAEFKTAAAAVIDRIKAGDHLPKAELDREWTARLQLLEARGLAERLRRNVRRVNAPISR